MLLLLKKMCRLQKVFFLSEGDALIKTRNGWTLVEAEGDEDEKEVEESDDEDMDDESDEDEKSRRKEKEVSCFHLVLLK